MAKQKQFRGGTSLEHDSFTGAAREVTVDTTDWRLRVHDGVTVGGNAVALKSEVDAIQVDSISQQGLPGKTPSAYTETLTGPGSAGVDVPGSTVTTSRGEVRRISGEQVVTTRDRDWETLL